MNKEKFGSRNDYIRIAGLILLHFTLLLITSCGQENNEIIQKKLDMILSDDLNTIIEDIPKDGLIYEPCYDLVLYQEYEEGNYSHKAVANFHFLKNINAKIVRKYRYYRKNRMWERYFNEYNFSPDTLSNCKKE